MNHHRPALPCTSKFQNVHQTIYIILHQSAMKWSNYIRLHQIWHVVKQQTHYTSVCVCFISLELFFMSWRSQIEDKDIQGKHLSFFVVSHAWACRSVKVWCQNLYRSCQTVTHIWLQLPPIYKHKQPHCAKHSSDSHNEAKADEVKMQLKPYLWAPRVIMHDLVVL